MYEAIKKYATFVNEQYKMGEISQIEMRATKLKFASKYGLDMSRTSVFIENMFEKAGITETLLFGKDGGKGIVDKLSKEQLDVVKQFMNNLESIYKNPQQMQEVYHQAEQFFKDITNFYKEYLRHGQNVNALTKEEIDNLITNMKVLNDMMTNTKVIDVKSIKRK